MTFALAIKGSLRPQLKAYNEALKFATSRAVVRTAEKGKDILRRQVVAAGLGKGLEKAWRVNDYPRRKDSRNKAAVIFSKAVRLHSAFMAGGTISAGGGRWLPIPTAAGKRFAKGGGPAGRNSRKRRWSAVERAEDRFGSLRFVRVDGDTALLIAEKPKTRRAAGGKRRRRARSATARKRRGKVIFVLKKQVRLGKRLDLGKARATLDRTLRSQMNVEYRKAGFI